MFGSYCNKLSKRVGIVCLYIGISRDQLTPLETRHIVNLEAHRPSIYVYKDDPSIMTGHSQSSSINKKQKVLRSNKAQHILPQITTK